MQVKRSSLTARVLGAIGMLGSAQAAGIVCSVVRTKFIALWLGPAGVGLNSILNNGVNLISTATQLNIRDSAVRDVAALTDDEARRIKCVAVRRWAVILGAVGALTMILFSPLLSMSAFAGSQSHTLDFALLAPAVFFGAYSAGEFAIMQAYERLSAIARANVTAAIVATCIAIPLIYFLGLDAIVILFDTYSIAIAACVTAWRVKVSAPSIKMTTGTIWRYSRSFLSLGLAMSVSLLMAAAAQYAFAAYVSSTGSQNDLGIYQSGSTIINSYIGILFSAVAMEYYPRLTRFTRRPNMCRTIVSHQIRLLSTIIVPVAVIFVFLADIIVRILYSSAFEGVLPYVTFAIAGTLFRGISICYAYRILAAGDSRAFMLTESLSAIIGLVLNIIAYKHWSFAGLGVSYVVWYAIYTVITAIVCRVRYGLVIGARNFLPALLAAAAIATAIAIRLIVT